MDTVRSLGGSERTDIVAKSRPEYFGQLRRHLWRSFKAFLEVNVAFYLISREGYFPLLRVVLGVIAAGHILEYKGVKYAFWTLFFLSISIGPRLPLWAIQTIVLQQLFMYELLQPYLARVQFKSWEERAWLAQYEVELQGFAFGAWCLCSIPWIGVAGFPFMFPAVAILLTRSCGSLENTRTGVRGDVVERMTPGVKAVALGKSRSVNGDWDSTKVSTFMRSTYGSGHKPEYHIKDESTQYTMDPGFDKPITEQQLAADYNMFQFRRRQFNLARMTGGWPTMDSRRFPLHTHMYSPHFAPSVEHPGLNDMGPRTPRGFGMHNPIDRGAAHNASSVQGSSRDTDTTTSQENDQRDVRESRAGHHSPSDPGTNASTGARDKKSWTVLAREKRKAARDAKEQKRALKNAMRKRNEGHPRERHDTSDSQELDEIETRSDEHTEIDEQMDGVYQLESEGHDHGLGGHGPMEPSRGSGRGRGGWRGWPFARITRGRRGHHQSPNQGHR